MGYEARGGGGGRDAKPHKHIHTPGRAIPQRIPQLAADDAECKPARPEDLQVQTWLHMGAGLVRRPRELLISDQRSANDAVAEVYAARLMKKGSGWMHKHYLSLHTK